MVDNNYSNSNNGLPKGWAWTKFADVLGFVKGKKPFNLGSRTQVRIHPYINIKAFEKKVFDEYTDGRGVLSLRRTIF